ncbi:GNAT family N-acetyltransferase [Parasphingorhabdus sp.]|uniref:GNAT family N-acetyltransferase n=1 Tax=Parasphingorhabdus sp. TaxID=2709688 RepID=UPI003266B30B
MTQLPDIRFRPAKVDDVPELHSLVESAYRGETAKRGWTHEADLLGGQRTDPAALKQMVEDADQTILLGISDDKLIGCVQMVRITAETSYLGLLTVDPNNQSGGIGKLLLSAGEDHAGQVWKTPVIEMKVIKQRSSLIAWYERRGYKLTGEYQPFPLDDPDFGIPKTQALEFAILRKELGLKPV